MLVGRSFSGYGLLVLLQLLLAVIVNTCQSCYLFSPLTLSPLITVTLRSATSISQVTRTKSKSGAVVKHQRMFVVLKTTSNVKQHFKSGAAQLYHSLVTSLLAYYPGSFPRTGMQEERVWGVQTFGLLEPGIWWLQPDYRTESCGCATRLMVWQKAS